MYAFKKAIDGNDLQDKLQMVCADVQQLFISIWHAL